MYVIVAKEYRASRRCTHRELYMSPFNRKNGPILNIGQQSDAKKREKQKYRYLYRIPIVLATPRNNEKKFADWQEYYFLIGNSIFYPFIRKGHGVDVLELNTSSTSSIFFEIFEIFER